ncbi:hypothetical protein WMF11_45420 [Sorangium sp. So ce295]|uniref:hypothetical protein n=1 Tax=Sorangium sp. So ce295 TaxID=3133295 RepID=UPI003F5DB6E5
MASLVAGALGACGTVEIDTGPGGTGAPGGTGDTEPFPETCDPPDIYPVCDTDVKFCGNGVLDTCEVCWSVDGNPAQCVEATEGCDGAVSETCSSLGYVGGRTACSDTCSIDVRDCDSCLGAPNQLACARPRVDGYNVSDIAMASDEQGLVAAWLNFDDKVRFARFSTSLELERHWDCLDAPWAARSPLRVALAPSPGGFIMAVGGGGDSPELWLRHLDPDGEEIAVRLIKNAAYPVLAARPGAPPLLVYASTDVAWAPAKIVAELLDEDGEATWQATVADTAHGETAAAAFADPGFVVSTGAITDDGEDAGATVLVPIDASGEVGLARELAGIRDVALAPAGAGRVGGVWLHGERFEVGWLDGQAALASDPVAIATRDPVKDTQEHAITVSNGRAIVALVEEEATQVSLFHVDADGSLAVPRYAFAREPAGLSWLAAAPADEGAALVWTTYAEPASSRFVLGRAQR